MATEPFDNPDYEKFIYDFRSVTGQVPQTTTATAERHPERIRAFMKELGPDAIRLCERMGGNGKGKFVRYGITCTAGLLVNMVRKTMEFVEPELPSEEYPKGYSVRETLTFADAGEFEAGMKRLFRTWAREKLPEDRPLYFNAACRIAEKEEAVEFWGDGVGCSIAKEEDFLQAVRLVREGAVTLEELCRTLSVKNRRAFLLRQKIQYLYEKGCVRWA